ncbi:GGDEF domain-containing protein [Rhodococcoides fascians]|uniref:GGDEF domain-containing protein n=1 Tax=Rhodococcoides fascians TaxID=1828 RepID=UPI00056CAE42|nr:MULTISPECIES: GGDEF domain-containing protein [Rhodococcus]OZE99921.1 sensor domain-containing diguanylate cyclase [Rhodococcus sp. 15-1189-1-1a]OZF12499.1 sensor domain-containing diguanylate cyclase [Rhodococcus sp. 14-2686-1-2]
MDLQRVSPRVGSAADVTRRAALIGAVVFLACLFGIATRLPGTLAVFWPANAVLLGILLRSPRSATPATWVGASLGYFAADTVTGTPLFSNVAFNLCNIAGVAAGFMIFRFIGQQRPWLTRVQSLALVAAVILVASSVAGVAGGFANSAIESTPWQSGWARWFSGEFLNYMAVMPAVLTAPTTADLRRFRRRGEVVALARRGAPAAALLVLCLILVWAVGGSGAITFAMPALVVAALTTGVFVTSLFIWTTTMWMLVLTADGHIGVPNLGAMPVELSVSIGLSFLAIAPIAVACVTNERRAAITALRHAVAHDDLTGALRRDEFFRRAHRLTRDATDGVATVLMMDLDHFKTLNDTYGHSAGDSALERFADDVRSRLDRHHLFARLGGEEFAVFCTDTTELDAYAIADTIRLGQFERATEQFAGHGVTVSIGLAHGSDSLEMLFDAADRALYDAKRQGRNRIVTATPASDVHRSS